MKLAKRKYWLSIILVPILGMALGVGITFLFDVASKEYGNLIVNLFFLLSCLVLLRIFNFSMEDLGLKFIKEYAEKHVVLALAVFSLYMLFYIFVIRIQSFRPFSSSMAWSLLTFVVVVFAEELYFRGVFYRFVEREFSAKTALIVSSLLFGIFHASQGMSAFVSRAFAGWLWGSVRYSSKMIILLIFPIHFAYNAIWLLFDGNWANPPVWAIYSLPAAEFLLGFVFLMIGNPKEKMNK